MRHYLIDEYIALNEALESLTDLWITLGNSTGPYRDQILAAVPALEVQMQQALRSLRDGFDEKELRSAINRRAKLQRTKFLMRLKEETEAEVQRGQVDAQEIAAHCARRSR